MPKEILMRLDAMEKIKTGANTLTDLVGESLGAKGRTVIIDRFMQPTIVTKDGATIVKNIELDNQAQNVGSSMIREASLKTLEIVGDGTTTVCVLARAIFNEGLKLIATGHNPVQLKKGIDKAVADVIEHVKDISMKVDDEMLMHVASVSANNDAEIGKLVSEVYKAIGKDGIVDISEAQSLSTEYKIIEGMRINKGFLDPYYCNDEQLSKAEYKEAAVFIYDGILNTAVEITQILKHKQGLPILIICNGLENEAFATLRVNRARQNYPCVVIESPFMGDRRTAVLEDIAILCGATVVSEKAGLKLEKVQPSYFGRADKVTVTQNHTTIVGGHGKKDKITQRVTALSRMADDPETKGFDKTQLNSRVAALNNGVAVLYVGGASSVEIKEKMDRCDDSVKATKAALEEGVVPGGGYALLSFMEVVLPTVGNKDFEAGYNLIENILSAPLRQMCKNAGLDDGYIINKCLESGMGYNLLTDKFEDLMATGIVDPAKVVITTIQQAASVAGTILTSAGMIVESQPKQ